MAKKIDYASMFTLRKDGRYQGSYTDDSGRHYLYDKDPERLWHKLNDPKEERPILFRDIAEDWYDKKFETMKPGTRSCYAANYKRAVERFGDMKAADLSAYDIQNHLEALKEQGYSASSISKQKVLFSLIYKHAIIDRSYGKQIKYNPADHVQIPSGVPKAKVREAPEDDIVKLIQEKAGTAYWGYFALFLICTGFRRGEALAVRWKDIDMKSGTITCDSSISHRSGTADTTPKTKNGYRSVPILPPILPAIQKPENAKPTDYVFHGDDPEKPLSLATYDRRWLHYCKEMGFVEDNPETRISKQGRTYVVHNYKPTLTAHSLRHGYATILFEADVDVYTAKKLLGHADINTTMAIYTHLREKKRHESVDKLKAYTQKGL